MYNTKNVSMRFWALSLLAFCSSVGVIQAQSVTSIRINEVLTLNEKNYQDNYGNHSPWIELYNTSAGTVDIKGCFLTDDLNNLKKYPIPNGDVLTSIRPHQHTLFWADNTPLRGTFHTSFTLLADKPNFIAFVSSDGKTIIDSVTIPANIPVDHSFSRCLDGVTVSESGKTWEITEHTTPSTNNKVLDSNEKLDRLKENDSTGGIMTITAMLVVFAGLAILFLAYKGLGKVAILLAKRNSGNRSKEEGADPVSGDGIAAIAMTLMELEQEAHDEEFGIITIRRMERKFATSWNSKLFGLRTFNRGR